MKDFDLYQEEAAKTIPQKLRGEKIVDNAVYGLCGELGELVDLLKKAKFQGHFLDLEKVILESGDVLWYLAELATGCGLSLGDIAQRNIKKLRQRYGESFDSYKSVNRTDNL